MKKDAALGRAQRLAQPDLMGPFADRHQHNIDNSNRAQSQRHHSHRSQKHIHDVENGPHHFRFPDRVPLFKRVLIAAIESMLPRHDLVNNLLPDPDKGDLFFDFEGDPLWTTDGSEWGLEYMWGVLEVGGAFRPLWAHDRASERKALIDFLAMVRKRRKRYPKMHIYHYAAYEKTALLRLAGRYGVGEDEVDDLLRSGVLVDLFPLVRKSIRVGTENYSLKSLEPLYMGSELRTGDVTT